jgi:hypothetical protein
MLRHCFITEMDFNVVQCDGLDGNDLAYDRDQLRSPINTAMSVHEANFLTVLTFQERN